MTRAGSPWGLAPEFNEFLFALIGEDHDGMPLSVLSALARLNVDPWEEAARFAALPTDEATDKLASVIGALPDGPLKTLGPAVIAGRLIALLPHKR